LGITSGERGETAGGCDATGAGVAGRDGTVDTGGCGVDKAGFDGDACGCGCSGGFDAGGDVAGGLTGLAGPWAIVRVGATAAGFFGADGASRKITSDRPTNPIATAAPPNRIIVFSGTAPPEVERG